jgi:hypothetical protein
MAHTREDEYGRFSNPASPLLNFILFYFIFFFFNKKKGDALYRNGF